MDTFDDIFAPVTTNGKINTLTLLQGCHVDLNSVSIMNNILLCNNFTVRAGGKFQPKGKQRPQKIASLPVPSMVPSDTKEENSGLSDPTCSNARLSLLPISVAGDRMDVPDGACLASFGVSGIGKTLIKCEELVSRVPESITTSGEPKSEVVVGERDDLGQEGGVKTTGGGKGDGVGCSGSRAPESEVKSYPSLILFLIV